MKQVKLLFLVGLSLISTVTLPMNFGRNLGAMARQAMPRLQAAAGKARAAAANAKAQAFPAFCRTVNVGIATTPFITSGIYLGLLTTLDQESMKRYMQDTPFEGGVEEVDDKLSELVRGSLNIPVFVGREEESKEQDLQEALQSIKEAGGLSYLSALKYIDFNCAAVVGRAIVMTSAMHTLLSSPDLFVNTQEHEQFCQGARAVIQHEEGHCLEKHFMQKIAWKIGSPIAIHMAGKRMGPIAKRLLKMNPIAKTKTGTFTRAVSGGIAKAWAASAGYQLLAKHHEYRADGRVDDDHKKYLIQMLYYVPGHGSLWQSKNPASYHERNKDYESSSNHPIPAKRIVQICGSVERGAELIVDAERQDQKKLYERRKAKMSTLKTEAEKIEFLITYLGYPDPKIYAWPATPEETFKGEYDYAENKIAWCLDAHDWYWIGLRNTVEQDIACAISS